MPQRKKTFFRQYMSISSSGNAQIHIVVIVGTAARKTIPACGYDTGWAVEIYIIDDLFHITGFHPHHGEPVFKYYG